MLKVNLFTSFLSSLPTPKALHLFPRKHLLAGVAQVSGQRSFYEILSVPRGPPLRTSIKNAAATFFFGSDFRKIRKNTTPAQNLYCFSIFMALSARAVRGLESDFRNPCSGPANDYCFFFFLLGTLPGALRRNRWLVKGADLCLAGSGLRSSAYI